MANPFTGEVVLTLDGQAHTCKLTLGALVGLEQALGTDSLMDLVGRMETGAFRACDIFAVLFAGLKGGGWSGTRDDLMAADIGGGTVAAAKVAAELLVRAFVVPVAETAEAPQ